MEKMESKIKTVGIVAGLIGLAAFLFPFFGGAGIWEELDEVIGIKLFTLIKIPYEDEPEAWTVAFYTLLAFMTGMIGACTFVAPLCAGIFSATGAVFLYVLKNYIFGLFYDLDFVRTEFGWTLAFIGFLVAALCAFVDCFLEYRAGKAEATEHTEKKA